MTTMTFGQAINAGLRKALDLRESAEGFAAVGDVLGEAFARNSLALALADRSVGDLPGADREIARGFALFAQRRHPLGESLAHVIHGLLRLAADDVAGAHRAFLRGDEIAAAGRDEFSRAMSEHHVGVVTPDRLPRLADRVAARGARRHCGEVRPGHAEADRDLAGAHVRDAVGDEERADPVRPTRDVGREPVLQRPDAAETRAQDHAGPLRQLALEASR